MPYTLVSADRYLFKLYVFIVPIIFLAFAPLLFLYLLRFFLMIRRLFFFLNDPAPTEFSPFPQPDPLPIGACPVPPQRDPRARRRGSSPPATRTNATLRGAP